MSLTLKASCQCISAAEALAMCAARPAPTLFDVRDVANYQRGHVEGAAHLSEDRLMAWMRRLPKDAPIVIYCYHGNASKVYAQMFLDFRYTQAYSVDGGYEALAPLLAAQASA